MPVLAEKRVAPALLIFSENALTLWLVWLEWKHR
jgi:hypothetical protein